ncbi:MAG: isochorismatase family cysteine hydrolase [Phototrophicaceae bacterium]
MIQLYFDPTTVALLVVDVQVDFCSPYGATARRGRANSKMQALPAKINRFVNQLEGSGVLPVYIRAIVDEGNLPANAAFFNKMKGVNRPTKINTVGSEFYGLHFPENSIFQEKTGADPFVNTDLADKLRAQGIETVLVTGVRTEICVDNTARIANREGFNVVIIEDLVATRDNNYDEAAYALKYLDAYVGFVISSDKTLSALGISLIDMA